MPPLPRSARSPALRSPRRAVKQIAAHRVMRKQPRILEYIADAPLLAPARRCRARSRTTLRHPARCVRRPAAIRPAIRLTSVVLPQPERPNSAVTPGSGRSEIRIQLEAAALQPDVDAAASDGPSQRRRPRASSSAASRPAEPQRERQQRRAARRLHCHPATAARCTAPAAACGSRRECWIRR